MKKGFSIDFIPEGSKLTFVRLTDKRNGGNAVGIYRCCCGKEKEIRATHVKTGKIRSCGCLVGETMRNKVMTLQEKLNRSLSQTTHGLSKHPLYKAYHGIIKRCENKNCKAYKYYGAVGVRMCKEWREDFNKFYQWALENGWKRGMEIDKDKKAVQLGVSALVYSPEMCSVLTRRENLRFQSTSVVIEYLGKRQTLSQWAEEFGANYKLFWARLKMGWSFEDAIFSEKVDVRQTSLNNRKIILNKENGIFYNGAKEAAESVGVNTNTLHCKLSGKLKNNTPFVYV